ncbi:hypothetical protein AMELA_G00211270 [Ameiurus melas]|uniref:Uncharacterized protein n=1 Tax=Ameiurus melas TaxID=219545 RepID=A0A7J6A4D2_AMEME|nr:hypothetical protein AMELA_G00211270 [Ameiurus melas]
MNEHGFLSRGFLVLCSNQTPGYCSTRRRDVTSRGFFCCLTSDGHKLQPRDAAAMLGTCAGTCFLGWSRARAVWSNDVTRGGPRRSNRSSVLVLPV